jgi:hypothetical protein
MGKGTFGQIIQYVGMWKGQKTDLSYGLHAHWCDYVGDTILLLNLSKGRCLIYNLNK